MNYQLGTPYFIEQEGKSLFPHAGDAASEDRIFIVCDNEPMGQALIAGVNSKISEKSRLSQSDFNDVLDDALSSCGQRTNMVNLAMALFQDNGVLVAQMGKSRVLHIATEKEEIAYDSRDQVLDIYSAKARVQILSQIADGDYIAVSLADRVELPQMVRIASDSELDEDQKAEAFFKVLSKNKPALVASYLIHVEKTTGILAGSKIKDVNWKWILIFACLAAAVVALAALSLKGDFSFLKNDPAGQQTENAIKAPEQPADSISKDNAAPTVETVQNETTQTAVQQTGQPATEKKQETKTEPVKKDTAKVSAPKKESVKPNEPNKEETKAEQKPAPAEKPVETPKEPEKPANPTPEQ